jgi:hypothetical protein
MLFSETILLAEWEPSRPGDCDWTASSTVPPHRVESSNDTWGNDMETATGITLQECADATGMAKMELASPSATPPQSAQPNLEEWIARYGGRARIPWAEWDRAVEAWKAERRAEFERNKLFRRMQSSALQQTLS